MPGVAVEPAHGEDGGGDADRQVDEEDPVPADRLGQDAAGEQADRRARGRDEAVDADRLRLLGGLREHRHDHPEDHRGGHRPADALDEARGHQHLLALGQPARERRDGEDGEAGEEQAAAAEQVAETTGEQQQAAEGDQVGVDDPREARLGEAEVALDRGQRHVHDRRVEDDHEHSGAQHDERGPAVTVGSGHTRTVTDDLDSRTICFGSTASGAHCAPAHDLRALDRLDEALADQPGERVHEGVALVLVAAWRARPRARPRSPRAPRATISCPASVTAITRARRSVGDGRRSASPAASSSSSVTTIVVLSSPTMRASSICVCSPPSAASRTCCARGEMPRSSRAAVSSVVSV